METLIEIWDDETGDHIQVGPDRDGLGMIEIRRYSSSGKIEDRFAFPVEIAKLLATAIQKLTV